MFKKVMAALLATVAFTPAAQAQEEGQDPGNAGRRGEMQHARERGGDEGQRGHAQREDRQTAPQPQFQRPERQPDQPRQPPPPQARNDGDRGGEGRGNMIVERAQRQQAEVQARASFQGNGDRGRGDRPNDWRRGDAGRQVPVVEQRRADEAHRQDGNWRNGGGRLDDQRHRDDARRNDGNRIGNQRWDTHRGGNDNRTWGNDRRRNDTWSGSNWNGNNWSGRNDWSRRWRDDNRYDWGRYRQQNRNLFRLPRYYAPNDWNYGYRRFSIGVTLSSLLWDQDYWIDDPAYYRLPPAYGPYRWVRYYNDALLVDVRSGYVVDTVYDIFW